jgi:hypothetical protein
MTALGALPERELDDDECDALIAAIRELEFTWDQVRADVHAIGERRKQEATIREAEAVIDAAWETESANLKVIQKSQDAQAAAKVEVMGTDYSQMNRLIADARSNANAARYRIDLANQKLRQLRIDNPRAFGAFPE